MTTRSRAATIDDTAVLEGNADSAAHFRVTLSAASALPVTAEYRSADGDARSPNDYLAVAATLTFAPGRATPVLVVVNLTCRSKPRRPSMSI